MDKKLSRDPLKTVALYLFFSLFSNLLLREIHPLRVRKIRVVHRAEDGIAFATQSDAGLAEELINDFCFFLRDILDASFSCMLSPMFETCRNSGQELNQRLGTQLSNH